MSECFDIQSLTLIQVWVFWYTEFNIVPCLQNFPHNRYDVQVVLAKATELSYRER